MRRSAVIAVLGQDIRGIVTARVLRNWAGHPNPASIPALFAYPEGVLPLGHCVRFWRQGDELWAEMEVRDEAIELWPDPSPPELHADVIAGLKSKTSDQVIMMAVMVTTMPRGIAGALFESADQVVRARKAEVPR